MPRVWFAHGRPNLTRLGLVLATVVNAAALRSRCSSCVRYISHPPVATHFGRELQQDCSEGLIGLGLPVGFSDKLGASHD